MAQMIIYWFGLNAGVALGMMLYGHRHAIIAALTFRSIPPRSR